MEIRVRVDWIRCDGSGLCGALAPDLIALDEWRYPLLPAEPIEGSRRHEIQRAIDCCPMRALSIEKDAAPPSLPSRALRRLRAPARRPQPPPPPPPPPRPAPPPPRGRPGRRRPSS